MIKNYSRALAQATSQTGLLDDSLPERPPFDLAEVLGEEISPQP